MTELNYYEWLGVPASGDTDEIVRVLDDRYKALQLLATHPDPAKVRQAEIEREIVEQARAVLTDPIRRQVYDLELAGSAAGGLADPAASAIPQVGLLPAPPRPKGSTASTVGAGLAGGQVCPKCGTANDAGSKHCLKCGTALLKSCPNCHHSVPHQAIHCPDCGVNMGEFARQQAEAEQKRIEAARRQAEIDAQLGPLQQRANSAWRWTVAGYVLGLCFYSVGGIPFWLVGLSKARSVLKTSRLPGDELTRAKAGKVQTWSIIGLIIPLIVGIVLLYLNNQ